MAAGAPRPATTRRERWLEADRRYSSRLRFTDRPRWRPLRRLAILLAHSGDSWYWGAGLALAWWLGGTETRLLVVRLVVAILVLAIIVFAVKRRVRRARPEGDWGALYRRTDPNSFPSGHAARMAMLAVLAWGLGPAWLGWLLLVWAPLVALARVAMGVHYLSDVAAGAAIGIVVGSILLVVFAAGAG